MRSQYYQGMIHDLVKQFVDSIPDSDLCMLDTWERTATREQPLSDGDEILLTNALRENWLALKFVTHFISVEDDDERSGILQQLLESVRNAKISPAAAHAAGYTKGVCLGMDKCAAWIKKDAALSYRKERLEEEWNNAPFGNYIHWDELFNQLHHLNSNYQYLFD